MSDPEGNSFVFPREDEDEVEGNIWTLKRPNIKRFVIFLDFHFNSDKRKKRSESKQSTRF